MCWPLGGATKGERARFSPSREGGARKETRILLTAEEPLPEFGSAHARVEDFLRGVRSDFPDLGEVFILTAKGGKVVYSTARENEGTYRVLDTFFMEGKKRTF